MQRLVTGPLAIVCVVIVLAGHGTALAQQALKVNTLILEPPVSGVLDKVFTFNTAEFPPGVSTGRHPHPGDE
jgi:hypothetical protein